MTIETVSSSDKTNRGQMSERSTPPEGGAASEPVRMTRTNPLPGFTPVGLERRFSPPPEHPGVPLWAMLGFLFLLGILMAVVKPLFE